VYGQRGAGGKSTFNVPKLQIGIILISLNGIFYRKRVLFTF
jgi:hypothetical protein